MLPRLVQHAHRGLALLPGVGVVSASHDHTLKVWTFDGECIAELVGHDALVYCAAATADGLVASGSEDNTARLWQADGTPKQVLRALHAPAASAAPRARLQRATPRPPCTQTLEHPGNVWDVAFLPDSDLVTACSDHVARVWTCVAERAASAELVQAYQAALTSKKEAAAAAAQQGGGEGGGLPAGLRLEDPGVLLQPGTKSGQIKVVREGGAGVAYSWDAGKSEWERVGEVVGGDDTVAPAGKMHNGQQWDYGAYLGGWVGEQGDGGDGCVFAATTCCPPTRAPAPHTVFDVDIEDGAPPKKLALNRGQNPYDVADSFLAENNLPSTYTCARARARGAGCPLAFREGRRSAAVEHPLSPGGAALVNCRLSRAPP